MTRTFAHWALLVALTLALAGCGNQVKTSDKAERSPSPNAAFATDEEALAAAVAVYDRLTVLGDEIAREGGADAERLEEVATGEFLKVSLEGFESYQQRGIRQVGSVTFRDPVLQQYTPDQADAVVIYICEDVGDVDIVDRQGTSVVSPERPDTYYFQVAYQRGADDRLRVSSRQRWDERSC